MATAALQHEMEQLFYHEAELLDSGRLHEWLDLFADDVRYWMPTREAVQSVEDEVVEDELGFSLYDEDKASLLLRVTRLDTGMAHVEEPRSITRHLFSNVILDEISADELEARLSFIVFQLRHEQYESHFFGRRVDRLRRVGPAWKIARRTIYLDQAILPRVLSIFF